MARKRGGAGLVGADQQKEWDDADCWQHVDRLATLIELQKSLAFEVATLTAKLKAAKRRLKVVGWDVDHAAAAVRRANDRRKGGAGPAREGETP